MRPLPTTQYAKSGDVHIAYQTVGDGPVDLVMVGGYVSHIEMMWWDANNTRLLNRLADFSRLIVFDRRGLGLSDRLTGVPTLEERMDDVRAVMDAAGSERAFVLGISEGAAMSVLFAATYPERCQGLILCGGVIRYLGDDEFPHGIPADELDERTAVRVEHWGEGRELEILAPSVADDETFRATFGMFCRMSCSPGAYAALIEANRELDVRHVLPSVSVPTVLIHRTDDRGINVGQSRYAVERIPGARLVELGGVDHLWTVGDSDAIVDEIEAAVTGMRPASVPDRTLATVLFTDIVGSTEAAVEMGDQRWRETLDAHDDAAAREVERFQGRMVKGTGDGVLAVFDGPARAIRSAQAIAAAVRPLGLEVRAGLHTGEIEERGDDIGGIAVHVAQRVTELAGAGEVFVSRTVKDLVAGSGIEFDDRGTHELKGVPDEWRVLAVTT